MHIALDIGCGAFWSITYIAAIVLGFRNRTHCIPALSVCMNFSWELLVVVKRLLSGSAFGVAFWIQVIWCLLDLGIILTWQLFRERKDYSRTKDFLLFAGVFLAVYFWAYVADGWEQSVFLINLIMSLEFIAKARRNAGNWTSKFIAVAKLSGTLSATILNGLLYWNLLILWLGGLCLLADFYYLGLLLKKGKGKLYEKSEV